MELDVFKLERTRAALKQIGVEAALFSDFYNVSYLTGYTTFLENGPNPFTRGFAAATFAPQQVTLIAEGASGSIGAGEWSGTGESFEGYNYRAPWAPPASIIDAVARVAAHDLPQHGKVGVERAYLPTAIWLRLIELRPDVTWIDLPPELMLHVRAVKGPIELERLRACAKLAEVGQEAVRQLVQQPGLSEIHVYSQAKAMMETYLGERFALQNALHGGLNSGSPFPGTPSAYVLQAGDLVISDMVPYYGGYWGDSCSTYVVGGADTITAEHRHIHQISRDAFLKGFDAIKPGLTGGQLDTIVRDHVKQHGYDYLHHTGHGVGVSNHEEPRLVINSQTVLEADMVLLMEPAVYIPGYGGVRQERMVRVTEQGAEFLSLNSFELA